MKKNNTTKKTQQIWIKGVLPLSFSLGLQAYSCGPVDTHTNLARTNASEFRKALENQHDISFPSKGGIDLLHAAVNVGSLQNVKEVLARAESDHKRGHSFSCPDFPNTLDNQGRLALNQAIQGGKTAIAIALIQSKCIDILKKDKKGRSPFHMAARCKNKKVVAALFACVQDSNDPRGYTKAQINKFLLEKSAGNKGCNVISAAFLPKHRHYTIEMFPKQLEMYQYVFKLSEPFLSSEDSNAIHAETASICPEAMHTLACSIPSASKESSGPVSKQDAPIHTPLSTTTDANTPPPPPPLPPHGMTTKPSLRAKQGNSGKPAQNTADGTRSGCLDQIRKGTILKPTKPTIAPKPTSVVQDKQANSLAEVLRKAVEKRQPATQGPSSEEETDESSVSDNEWDD